MKLKIEDLRIGQSVEVQFTGKIISLNQSVTGVKTATLQNEAGISYIVEGHLAEVPAPEEIENFKGWRKK